MPERSDQQPLEQAPHSEMAALFDSWADKLEQRVKSSASSRVKSSASSRVKSSASSSEKRHAEYLKELPGDLRARADQLNESVRHWHELRIWSNNLAPELVGHDEMHAKSVERLAVELLRDCWDPTVRKGFAPIHLQWLSVAAWLHDWGHVGGVISEWDKGKDNKRKQHYFTSPFEVRAVHGLLSQEWLGETWTELHKLDKEIYLPAGLLCAHHQRWTQFAYGRSTDRSESNLYDGSSALSYGERILRDKAIEVWPLRDAWDEILRKSSVWQTIADHSEPGNSAGKPEEASPTALSAEFEKFYVLLLILRIADAADYGQHRTPMDIDSRRQLWASYIHRQSLTHSGFPEDDPDSLTRMLNAVRSSEQTYLKQLKEKLEERLSELSGKNKSEAGYWAHMKDYVELIANQEQYYNSHNAVAILGVTFETELAHDHWDIIARVQPSDSKPNRTVRQQAANRVGEAIKAEWRQAEKECTGLTESVIKILNADLTRIEAKPVFKAASEESRPRSVGSNADSVVAPSAHFDKGSADSGKLADEAGQSVDGDHPVPDATTSVAREWWSSEAARTHVLGSVASVLGKPLVDQPVLTTQVGASINSNLDEMFGIPGLWAARPWVGPNTKTMGQYLELLDAGISEVKLSNGYGIEWPEYAEWLGEPTGSVDSEVPPKAKFDQATTEVDKEGRSAVVAFTDDRSVSVPGTSDAANWWYSKEGMTHVLCWVATVLREKNKTSVGTNALGTPIRREADELGISELWKMRPYGPGKKRLGEYLASLGVGIIDMTDSSEHPSSSKHPSIEWSDYKKWLGDEMSEISSASVPGAAAEAARGWWYTLEAKRLVPRWVAEYVSSVVGTNTYGRDQEIATTELGHEIKVKASQFASRNGMGKKLWEMRPWGPGKPPMWQYMSDLNVGITAGEQDKTIRWPEYVQWLDEDIQGDLSMAPEGDRAMSEDEPDGGDETKEGRRGFLRRLAGG